MRIRGPDSRPSAQKATKTAKAGGKFAAKLGPTEKAEAVDRVERTEGVSAAEAVEAAFMTIAEDFKEGHYSSLEDATHAFVQAVLRERWKFLDAKDPDVQRMEQFISGAMTKDPKMAERLQVQFDRYARRAAKSGEPDAGR
jgi:hypothetical protein